MDFWRDHQKVRLLGSGSYGSAVLYVNRSTAAHYVVKEVDISVMDRCSAKIAEQEAKILMALRHPNIVACQASWVQAGRLFIVMEYCSQGVFSLSVPASEALRG
jgi:serine/threonine protein kinase